MARTQATTYTSIWSDPEFVGLTADAQRTYWLLMSQPKLTLCGSLDWLPARWAKLAADTEHGDITTAVEELAARRFVVVHDDELILRTFVANDLGKGTVNGNLVKGMWSAWGALVSPLLRKVVVDEMPPQVWNREGIDRPSEAEELRSEPRLELPLGPWSEPSVDLSLFSDPCSLLTATSPSPQTTTKAPEPADPDAAAEDREQAVRAAAVAVGRTVAAEAGKGPGYAVTVTKRILTDTDRTDRDRIRTLVDEGKTADEIAAAWATGYPDDDRPADNRPPLRAVDDPPPCPDCLGSGWVSDPGSSVARRCDCNPHPAARPTGEKNTG